MGEKKKFDEALAEAASNLHKDGQDDAAYEALKAAIQISKGARATCRRPARDRGGSGRRPAP